MSAYFILWIVTAGLLLLQYPVGWYRWRCRVRKAGDLQPVLQVSTWRWSQLARSREYWKPSRARVELLERADFPRAIEDGSTLLHVRFVGRRHRRWNTIPVEVNHAWVNFPTERYCCVRILVAPVLLQSDYPFGAGRRAVLTPRPGMVNEVVLRMYRWSPMGHGGVWLVRQTRSVFVDEIDATANWERPVR